MGYSVDLIPPHRVKPFVVGNKSDHNDRVTSKRAVMKPLKPWSVPYYSLPYYSLSAAIWAW